MDGESLGRAIWMRIETIHAVTYFGEESVEAGAALGLSGFWMTYFGFRGAPLGPVVPGVVDATFFNFDPGFVRRWVPEVWSRCETSRLVDARAAAAATTLRRVEPQIERVAALAAPLLSHAVEHADTGTRALFAANREVAQRADPVEHVWQLCTTLREHRGDGHNAVLSGRGVSGAMAHVLISAEGVIPAEDLQRTRGLSEGSWADAVARCEHAGWVDRSGRLTEAGRALRADVEAATDALATQPFQALRATDRQALVEVLTPAATTIANAGVIRFPNPIGLPRLIAPGSGMLG